MTAFEFLKDLHSVCHFQTREGAKVGRASNAELKRWIINKAFRLNAETVEVHEEMDFDMFTVTLFTGSAKITLL